MRSTADTGDIITTAVTSVTFPHTLCTPLRCHTCLTWPGLREINFHFLVALQLLRQFRSWEVWITRTRRIVVRTLRTWAFLQANVEVDGRFDTHYAPVIVTMMSNGSDLQPLKQETHLSLTNRATHFVQTQWRWWLPKTPHICHHAQFGRSALKDVGRNTGEPKNFGRAETKHSWARSRGWSQDTPLATCVTTSNLIVLRQRCTYK